MLAPDLPGHGADKHRWRRFRSIFMDTVVDAARSASEPVVLVGHSTAGAFVSRAAEQIPEAIAQLVYLTSYLPRSDESLASLARLRALKGLRANYCR